MSLKGSFYMGENKMYGVHQNNLEEAHKKNQLLKEVTNLINSSKKELYILTTTGYKTGIPKDIVIDVLGRYMHTLQKELKELGAIIEEEI